jgi:hypothetical protein
MALAEKIEHGKIVNLFCNGKGRMRYKRSQKKLHHRIWRRFKEDLKPMYNRFCGWEF